MGDSTGIPGAVLAIVREIVQLAKTAHRCKENCNMLVITLESIAPILMKLSQSSVHRSIECENWLLEFVKILEIAKVEVSRCKPSWGKPFTYKSRAKLSKSLVDIDVLINAKMQQMCLFQYDMIEEIYEHGKERDVRVEDFVSQPTPKLIVDFKGNVFQKLLGHILSKGDAMEEPMTIGLKGQGGVGKTLLANMVFNNKTVQEKFGSDCMIYVTIGRDASISSLYKHLAKGLRVGGVYEEQYAFRKEVDQRSFLMEIFLKRKVLLVLDDVWENGRMIWWLDIAKGRGSVTLVTTRYKAILSSMKANVILDVQSLSMEESWRLFSIHAFGTNLPPSHEIEKVAHEICAQCNGLPLALEVMGSVMWEKKDVRLWQDNLTCMKKSQKIGNSDTVENRLFNCLRYSYDGLDDASKKCFLYVAAYPVDYDIPIDELCSIWVEDDIFETFEKEERMQSAYNCLTSLADRSMIVLDGERRILRVHNILRDIAIRIINDADLDEWASGCYFHPGKVLKELSPIKGVMKRMSLIGSTILDYPMDIEVCELRICLLSNLQVCNALQGSHCFYARMKKLQLLHVEHSLTIEKSNDDALCSSQFFDSIKRLKSIARLTLYGCESMRKLPQSIGELKSLTSLDLHKCKSLKELPQSIGELKSLTSLSLSRCESLEELPQSIGELKFLTSFNLQWCQSLRELPQSIGELKFLTSLDLEGCESLKELPQSIGELKFLTSLNLRWCEALRELPQSIGELKSLTSLDLEGCNNLQELPQSIGELKFLTSLNLRWCQSLKEFPQSIGNLKVLKTLDVSLCEPLEELPQSIEKLKSPKIKEGMGLWNYCRQVLQLLLVVSMLIAGWRQLYNAWLTLLPYIGLLTGLIVFVGPSLPDIILFAAIIAYLTCISHIIMRMSTLFWSTIERIPTVTSFRMRMSTLFWSTIKCTSTPGLIWKYRFWLLVGTILKFNRALALRLADFVRKLVPHLAPCNALQDDVTCTAMTSTFMTRTYGENIGVSHTPGISSARLLVDADEHFKQKRANFVSQVFYIGEGYVDVKKLSEEQYRFTCAVRGELLEDFIAITDWKSMAIILRILEFWQASPKVGVIENLTFPPWGGGGIYCHALNLKEIVEGVHKSDDYFSIFHLLEERRFFVGCGTGSKSVSEKNASQGDKQSSGINWFLGVLATVFASLNNFFQLKDNYLHVAITCLVMLIAVPTIIGFMDLCGPLLMRSCFYWLCTLVCTGNAKRRLGVYLWLKKRGSIFPYCDEFDPDQLRLVDKETEFIYLHKSSYKSRISLAVKESPDWVTFNINIQKLGTCDDWRDNWTSGNQEVKIKLYQDNLDTIFKMECTLSNCVMESKRIVLARSVHERTQKGTPSGYMTTEVSLDEDATTYRWPESSFHLFVYLMLKWGRMDYGVIENWENFMFRTYYHVFSVHSLAAHIEMHELTSYYLLLPDRQTTQP